jgi:ADP-heptose:LPS heptosyltransferase
MGSSGQMINRILIIKFWALGDIVMATPILNAIKAGDYSCHICWLVDSKHADVLKDHSLVDEVFIIDTGQLRSLLRSGDLFGWIAKAASIARSLANKRFDAVINCHPEKFWTMLFCWAPKRVALFSSKINRLAALFYTQALGRPNDRILHSTHYYLQTAETLGFKESGLHLSVGDSKEADAMVDKFLQEHGIDRRQKIILLSPISTEDIKDWPLERYRLLAEWLSTAYGAAVVVTAGSQFVAQLKKTFDETLPRSILLPDSITVAQFVALIRRSSLVVSGDSSPMHIAAALHVPYVTLFGPTDPQELAPLVGAGKVIRTFIPCVPCKMYHCNNVEYRQCLNSIGLADVQAAISELLGEPSNSGTQIRLTA